MMDVGTPDPRIRVFCGPQMQWHCVRTVLADQLILATLLGLNRRQ